MRQDLAELKDAVADDAKSAVQMISSFFAFEDEEKDAVADNLERSNSVGGLNLGKLTSAITEFLSNAVIITDEGSASSSTGRAHLHITKLLDEPKCFISSVDFVSSTDARKFDESFKLVAYAEQIDHLKQNYPKLNAVLSQEVPRRISLELFWKQFFYALYKLIREDEERRRLISSQVGDAVESAIVDWEAEDEAAAPAPGSEENQAEVVVDETKQKLEKADTSSYTKLEATADEPATTTDALSDSKDFEMVTTTESSDQDVEWPTMN